MPRNAPEGVFSTPAAHKRRLLDYVQERLRYLHYSLRAEPAYADWIKRYILTLWHIYTPRLGLSFS